MGAFEIVILAVIVGAAAVAVMLLLTTASTWRDYGRGHLSMDTDTSHRSGGASADELEREQEIRQLLEARNALRSRRGRPTLDVEHELQRLTGPKIDASLREEIREMVIARNHRRRRVGKPPLDVEAEVERKVAEFSDGLSAPERERPPSP